MKSERLYDTLLLFLSCHNINVTLNYTIYEGMSTLYNCYSTRLPGLFLVHVHCDSEQTIRD